MHKGVFKGNNLTKNCNILILGESHHHTKSNDPNYTTENVVKNYLHNPNDRDYKFFDKIAACFGYSAEEREIFWNKVWFGNYVDESDCGIRTNRAKILVECNKDKYNKELFEFINQNGIDIVFCFSRLVYQNLPRRTLLEDKSVRFYVDRTGGKKDWIDKFIYKPGTRANDDLDLSKKLTIYGLRHPSARCGFCPEYYMDCLQKEIHL